MNYVDRLPSDCMAKATLYWFMSGEKPGLVEALQYRKINICFWLSYGCHRLGWYFERRNGALAEPFLRQLGGEYKYTPLPAGLRPSFPPEPDDDVYTPPPVDWVAKAVSGLGDRRRRAERDAWWAAHDSEVLPEGSRC